MPSKSVKEIRREKFAAEVNKAGGVIKFADRYNENPDYVRQLVNGKERGGTNMGDRVARRMETLLGKPQNWFDHAEDVPLAVHTENDLIAIQIALSSLVKAVVGNIRAAGPDFSLHVAELAKVQGFSTRQGLLATLLGIAEQGQHTAGAAVLPLPPRGSSAHTKR